MCDKKEWKVNNILWMSSDDLGGGGILFLCRNISWEGEKLTISGQTNYVFKESNWILRAARRVNYPAWKSLSMGCLVWGRFSSLIFTVRDEVANVMFLHLSVCPQGGGSLPQCMLGYHIPRGQTPVPDQTSPGAGIALLDQASPSPQQTATVADITHSTGMHSCFFYGFAGVRIDWTV